MLVRVVANAIKPNGGGEMSCRTIVEMLAARGHRVVWHPTTEHAWPWPRFCGVGTPFWRNEHWECDLLFYLTNNTTLPESDRRRTHPPVDPERWRLATTTARRSVLHINWECIGDAVKLAGLFDRFAFLSTWLRDEYCRLTGTDRSATWVHASAVDLAPYRCCTPDYDRLLIVRHSNPWKWPRDSVQTIEQLGRSRRGVSLRLMGLPTMWAHRLSRKLPTAEFYAVGAMPPATFLNGGSFYIYPLKPEYREQGPRTIVEAMAAGLPCMVDDRDGPRDRVSRETGWRLRSHADYPGAVARITVSELREKGEASRERARTVFRPEDWADWLEEVAA